MFIQLKPFDQRDVDARTRSSSACGPRWRRSQGVKFFMQAGQDISVGGRLSRTQYQYTLTDTDSDELNHWAPILEQAMQKLPELQDVASDQQIAAPHIAIEIDRDAASRLGLSPSLIDQTLYDAFGQRQVATIYTSTNQYKVILEVQPRVPERSDRAVEALRRRPERRAGAAQHLRAFHHEGRAADGQPPGPVPGGDAVVQPGARRGARPGGRHDPGDAARAARAGHARTAVPGHGAGLPGVAVLDAAAASRRRSSSSTSCSACSTRATSTRSRSCRRCRRPASARCWR